MGAIRYNWKMEDSRKIELELYKKMLKEIEGLIERKQKQLAPDSFERIWDVCLEIATKVEAMDTIREQVRDN